MAYPKWLTSKCKLFWRSSLRAFVNHLCANFKRRFCGFSWGKWFVLRPLSLNLVLDINEGQNENHQNIQFKNFDNTWNATSRSLSRQATEIWEKLEVLVDWIVWNDNQICYHQSFFERNFESLQRNSAGLVNWRIWIYSLPLKTTRG